MKKYLLIIPLIFNLAHTAEPIKDRKNWEQRWVRISTNMLVNDRVVKANEIIERAAAAGYNGVVYSDSKTATFFHPDFELERWEKNVQAFREKARGLGLAFHVNVMPFGYADGLLAHDVNLATGYPVKNAKLQAKGGKLIPVPSAALRNGSFEEHPKLQMPGWFHDDPGKASFIDTETVHDGKSSLRFEGIEKANEHGHGRANQKIKVLPFQQYRVRFWIKCDDLSGRLSFFVKQTSKSRDLQSESQTVSHYTADWKEQVLTFNTLDCNEVTVYAGIWNGKGGRFWLDDFSIETVPMLNLLRRDSLPLKLTSSDGETTFSEGRDFNSISDPKLGRSLSWAGTYDNHHEAPIIELTPESRIENGDTVLLSSYHSLSVPDEQITCTMADPKIYEICSQQVDSVHKLLQPDGYFLGHDEIRTGGWEPDAIRRFKTSGEMFADNIQRCFQIANTQGKGKPICVWNDMYDPNHNARKDYYMVNNTITGSWKGLPKDLQIVTWISNRKSLEFFSGRGHKQIVAGYYDQDVVKNHQKWMAASKGIEGITGTVYCTWSNRWDDLELYAETWWGGAN